MASAFRFVSSRTDGQYSVWRGDQHLGYVTKVVHRIFDGRTTKTVVGGWTPGTPTEDLAIQKTREAAALALWRGHKR
jgi:hypothetical protein